MFNKKFTLIAALMFMALLPKPASSDQLPVKYTIAVPMDVGGTVTVTDWLGRKYEIGDVAALPEKTHWPSYTASAWGTPGEVCASAVNAVHLLVSIEKGKGRTMSIIPKETIAPAAGPGASIVILSKAAYGVFGAWAPPVGSEVTVMPKGSEETFQLAPAHLPKKGDTLFITVRERHLPYMVEIENRPGGRVTEWNSEGYSVIGRVIRPLAGTGRFDGTLFQKSGAIRANHCGVIDYSTSPRGEVGGFQIIPWDHALKSKEMQSAWDMTQWMIVGPADGHSMMGGTFPLFKQALVSGPSDGEKLWDVWSTYGRKSLLLVRFNGGAWQRMPNISGRKDYALRELTHLRLYFPFTDEPQKKD